MNYKTGPEGLKKVIEELRGELVEARKEIVRLTSLKSYSILQQQADPNPFDLNPDADIFKTIQEAPRHIK